MQIDTSGAVEVVEPETELVLVTGRRIEPGALFWPEEDSLYLLASTWEAVDPLDDDNDSISRMVLGRGEMTHKAMQGLIQLTFTPQVDGMLWRAVGALLSASAVFEGHLPRVARFLSQQDALGASFSLILLCQVTKIASDVPAIRTYLNGCAMAADIRFSPIP